MYDYTTIQLKEAIAQKLQNSTRGSGPPLGNSKISRAGVVHRPEIAKSRAQEGSTARKMRNPTRRRAPSLGKCRISRAGTVHRSEKAEFHAQEPSPAQEMQNSERGSSPGPRNR